jgi:DNA processing protein
MTDNVHSISLALAAFEVYRTPGRITTELREKGRAGLERTLEALNEGSRAAVETKAVECAEKGLDVTMYGDQAFPQNLVVGKAVAAPILFFRGNKELFNRAGIGMCGSRAVSETGLNAARTCGFEVSRRGLVVVSGYAKGVDSETHLAALRSGGSTVIVLAEGFDHFRIKKEFAEHFDVERTLVVSQFAPTQPWGAYAAMARNAIIYGLGLALVVIEAGERGGTLAAGEGALKLGRPVFVLDFGDTTPAGNRKLLEAGSLPVKSPTELGARLDELRREDLVRVRPDALF